MHNASSVPGRLFRRLVEPGQLAGAGRIPATRMLRTSFTTPRAKQPENPMSRMRKLCTRRWNRCRRPRARRGRGTSLCALCNGGAELQPAIQNGQLPQAGGRGTRHAACRGRCRLISRPALPATGAETLSRRSARLRGRPLRLRGRSRAGGDGDGGDNGEDSDGSGEEAPIAERPTPNTFSS